MNACVYSIVVVQWFVYMVVGWVHNLDKMTNTFDLYITAFRNHWFSVKIDEVFVLQI